MGVRNDHKNNFTRSEHIISFMFDNNKKTQRR